MLSHPNGWWRDTAHRLLVERGAKPVTPHLTKLARNAPDPKARLHAMWILDGIDAIQPSTVIDALNDPARDVRLSAIRIAERWLGAADHPIRAAILKRVDDPDPGVRRQLAASLGVMPRSEAHTSAIVTLLSRNGDDPVTVDAALSGLRGSEAAILERLLTVPVAGNSPESSGAENAVAMLAATIVRSAQNAAIQNLVGWLADGQRDIRYRSALLLGAEVALLGTSPPGTVVRRPIDPIAAGLPCPTCPGGRAGPGGAYAFQRSGDPTTLAGRGRGGGRGVRLSSEPVALSSLASGTDEIAARAKRVLERLDWPGKPGDAAPVPALTPEQQKRYAAGQEVYRNICQGCHQPDGRGQDKLAPGLIGSVLALAPAEITTRILLNGKEGLVGLMPPIGSSITDEQIASVLTYVRREWGQIGTAVDPDTVAGVRVLTKDRTRPWTDAELSALMEKQAGSTSREVLWIARGSYRYLCS
jgi:mono/diheme cytochrome c family protein